MEPLKLKWITIDKKTRKSNEFEIVNGRGRFYLFRDGNRLSSGSLQDMLRLAEGISDGCECCICGSIPKKLTRKDLLPSGWVNLGSKVGIFCPDCLN